MPTPMLVVAAVLEAVMATLSTTPSERRNWAGDLAGREAEAGPVVGICGSSEGGRTGRSRAGL